MAHIKEPKGVDFVIQSEPLTVQAREEITAFIQAYKKKAAEKKPIQQDNKPARIAKTAYSGI